MKVDYPRWVLEAMATGVIVLDRQLRLKYMNAAAEMLFALSVRQGLDMKFQELAIGADTVVEGMQRCLESGYPYTERQLQLILPGEQSITVDCTVSPLQDGGYALVEALLVELRQVDRQLRMTREEHLIAQHNISRILVRNLAHEIKNPLGGIRGGGTAPGAGIHR